MARREIEEWFWQAGNDLQQLSEELAQGRPKIANARFWEPRVDLLEEEHRFIIKAEIAGVKGEDIHLHYHPDRHSIILKGFRPEEDFTDTGRVGLHQLEIFYGEFQREIRLPEITIDASGIKAQYRNGFLIVMVPKMDRVVVSRTVTIKRI
jgi:HSP20 family protein